MSVGQSNFLCGGSPCEDAARGSKGRLAQIDPLRIEGPNATLVASQSWRRRFSCRVDRRNAVATRFRQRLNNLHLAATLRTGRLPYVLSNRYRGVFWCDRRRDGVLGYGHDLLLRSRRQQLADAGEVGLAGAVWQK